MACEEVLTVSKVSTEPPTDYTPGLLAIETSIADQAWPEDVTPVVSVLCFTFNHERYIRDALEGFLAQTTRFRVEIIVHDDASTDSTPTIVRQYQQRYPSLIKTITQTQNQYSLRGYAFVGDMISAAKGRYIALCDGDDYWTDPLKLQRQVDLMDADAGCVLSFHPCSFRAEESGQTLITPQDMKYVQYDYTAENVLERWGIPTAAMVFRNVLPILPPWFAKVASGDIAIAMLLYERGTFRCLEERMSVYRLTGLGASSSHHGEFMLLSRGYLYAKLNEHFNGRYEDQISRALLRVAEYHVARDGLSSASGDPREAMNATRKEGTGQIIPNLREIEVEVDRGKTVLEAVKKIGGTEQPYYWIVAKWLRRWRPQRRPPA